MPETLEQKRVRKHSEYMARRDIVLARNKTPEYAEKIRIQQRRWRSVNREKLRDSYKKFHANNRDRRRQQSLNSYIKNRDKRLAARKDYCKRFPEKVKASTNAWHSNPENKLRSKIRNAAYAKRNRIHRTKQQCEYIAKRRREDVQYRITIRLRSRVWDALQPQSAKKAARTIELLGCDSAFFKEYLEARFTPDMNWDNYGEFWQIDHIYPLVGFDLTIPENQKRAFHYTNCQPLSCDDNNFKSDKPPSELDRYYTDPFYRIEIYPARPKFREHCQSSNTGKNPPGR